MKTNTAKEIVAYLERHPGAKPNDLVNYLDISRQAIFRHLKKLLEDNVLIKTGNPPNVFYSIKQKVVVNSNVISDPVIAEVVAKNYLFITVSGEFLEGLSGFKYWCEKNNLPLEKTAKEYSEVIIKYSHFRSKKNGLIPGLDKFKKSFEQVYIDEVYYIDFYSLERFGKTKLGLLLLYAKQSQNKKLIKQIFEIIKKPVADLIKREGIDAVSFIPPTVSRKVQLQKELEILMALALPRLNIVKASNKIIVPQKTLNKLSDRIDNIDKTVFVDDNRIYNNILLIDDAIGSGATFNQIAKKIKAKKLVKGKVIGLAITGSFKGFDVISEV